MTNDGTGFGVLVSNNNSIMPLAGLGLSNGRTYKFSQDMKRLSGTEMGGLKVEFYNSGAGAGDTGDLRIPMIGDGSTWETYEYEVSIPFDVNGIKVVPLWGPGSSVAYDNVSFSAIAIPSPAVLNSDFELAGANWSFFSDNGQTTFTFPESGGNPGGFGQMENTASWGVLVSNSSAITPIDNFGIAEEGEYDFEMDMKIISGNNIGGLKIEYYTGDIATGDTGDVFPALIGNGSTWETYTFRMFIPGDATGIKVVPVAGSESTVGIDNIITPQGGASGFAGWIAGFPGVGELVAFDDDPDNDGSPNGLENFFGTDPSVGTQGLVYNTQPALSGRFLTLTHPQNTSPANEISAPIYEWSTDMETYYSGAATNAAGTSINFDQEFDTPVEGTTTVEASISGPVPEKVFIRVSVSAGG
jgi:hypothetical protein